MKASDAREQLCKMMGEIANHIGMKDAGIPCVCDWWMGIEAAEVPDAIIEEMWRRLTDPSFSVPDEMLDMGGEEMMPVEDGNDGEKYKSRHDGGINRQKEP